MSPDTDGAGPVQRQHDGAGSLKQAHLVALALVAILALLAGSAILISLPGQPGPVRSIQVDGLRYLREEEAIQFAGLQIGRVYRDVDLEQAESRLALHPAVRSAQIKQVGADALRVVVEERACVALVRNEEGPDGTTLYEVDAELMILAENRVRCSGVPLVRGSFVRDVERGDRFKDPILERLVRGLARLRSDYPELAARISELHLRRAGGLTLYLTPARVRVEMSAELDDVSVKRLYAAVAYFERDGARNGVIDLRGPGVVILPD
jgi:cell division protein FtsQ